MSSYIDLSQIVPIYQDVIDEMIEKLGKNVTLYYEKKPTDSATDYDLLNDGPKKPTYDTNVDGPSYDSITIKAIIKWFKRTNIMDNGIERPVAQCRIKTLLTNADDIGRADFIVPHSDSADYVNLKMKVASTPQIIGLGEDRYVIYFLEPVIVA